MAWPKVLPKMACKSIRAYHTDPKSRLKTDADESISDAMVGYWTNFAKYGNPNSPTLPVWKEYTAKNHAVMHLKQSPQMGTVPSEASLNVLEMYYQWRRTPEGKEWAK